MSSAPLGARSFLFTYDAESGSRRPTWFVALAGVLVVALALAGAVLGARAANAHDKSYEASCFGLKVVLTNYNASRPNTVSIVIDGVEQVPAGTRANFGANYTFQTAWDPSVDHTYAITVDGWDGWDLEVKPTTQKACGTPTGSLTATECNTTGGTTTVTANFSGFASHVSTRPGFPSYTPSYTATLRRDGTVVATVPNAQNTPGGTLTWAGQLSGHTYTFTITADGATNAGLTFTATAKSIACPELTDFRATVEQCAAPGAGGTITVHANVSPGRAYTIVLTHNGTTIQSHAIPASNTSTSVDHRFAVPEGLTGMQVVVTDTAAAANDPNRQRMSNLLSSDPCPKVPTLSVAASVCTTVGGALEITVELSNLIPGRGYEVLIDGVVVETIPGSAVTSSARAAVAYPTTAGSRVVTVRDAAVPSVATSSAPLLVAACPTQPGVAISASQCDVPGGTGSITANFSGLSTGRSYQVTITENGNALAAYPAVTIDSTTTSTVYANLVPGATYVVTIVDLGASGILGATSQTLAVCPDTPTITITPQCELLSDTTSYGVTLGKLQGGVQYRVTITTDTGADAAPPVTITGGAGGLAPTFQVPNGAFYTLAVTSVANAAITASVDVFAAVCDLPTFDLPPELPTLALTGGANTTMPMLGALGLVQFGVALLALAAMLQFSPRRRRA